MLSLSLLALAVGATAQAASHRDHAVFIEVRGAINSATQRYVSRAFAEAERGGARLVIVRLDTPGGLLDATRAIVEVLLSSPIPSVVYVAPSGAQAASAGTFIAAAANFAVMAPGTNIGAATPVSGGGGELPPTLANKATNDAAALMRAIAQERGRNAEKLDATVRQALSFSATEAVSLGVVDFVANDLQDMLDRLDGKSASTRAGVVVLSTRDLEVRSLDVGALERFLGFLAHPNVAYLLLALGGLGLVIELINPGLIVPGVVGAILLLLAFLGFGNLPVNWAGVGFILLAMVLFVLEVHVGGFGALGVGAIVSFLVGSFLLFFHLGGASPTAQAVRVSLWVVGSTAGAMTGLGGLLLWTLVRSRSVTVASGGSSVRLVGALGYAVTDIAPRGEVQVESERWSAVSSGGIPIPAGERVRVVAVDGLTLHVARTDSLGAGDAEARRTESHHSGHR